MPKVRIITFGCQANELDSERIAGILAREGYALTDRDEEADLIILNTCSIREKAEQKVYSRLGTYQALREGKGTRLGLAGCLAQREGGALLKRFPYLDLVVGNGEQLAEIPRLLGTQGHRAGHPAGTQRHRGRAQPLGPRPMADPLGPSPWVPGAAGACAAGACATGEPVALFPEDVVPVRESRLKAWVGIMEGCDNYCTFCVVPYTRGRERSRHPDDILAEVEGLLRAGYREITLLGQTVNSYGKKLAPPTTFAALLRRIDALVGTAMRVRFTTSHPKDVTPELIQALADLPSLCEHLHLPVQSGSTPILARMARTYTREEYLAIVEAVRAAVPGIALTTDVIVGFPGEDEADAADTLSLLEAVRYDGLFAFKYSPRPQTPAATYPDGVAEEVKAARLARVLDLQNRISLEANRALIGCRVEVLVDSEGGKRQTGLASGRTRTNKIVHFPGQGLAAGDMAWVRITEASAHHVKGVLSPAPSEAGGAEETGDDRAPAAWGRRSGKEVR